MYQGGSLKDKSHTQVPLLTQPQAHLAPEPARQACVCRPLQLPCACPRLLPPGPALGRGSPSWLPAFLLPSQSYLVSDGSKTSVYQSPSVSLCSRTKCGIPDVLAWPLGASWASPASFPASLTLGAGWEVLQPVGSLSFLRASCTVAFLVVTVLFSGQDELLSALSVTLCRHWGKHRDTTLQAGSHLWCVSARGPGACLRLSILRASRGVWSLGARPHV